MHTRQNSSNPVATIGVDIDIGKNTFHLVGLDKRGAIVLRTKVSRGQLERRLANVPCCLVGLEAGCGSHHIARKVRALGHDARLIPAQYVKAFLQGAQERLSRCRGHRRGRATANDDFRRYQDAGAK